MSTTTDMQSAEALPFAGFRVNISVEAILFVVLIALALVLRLPNLNTNPLDAAEAHEALAVYRVITPDVQGSRPVALNPLMFTADTITMTLGGAENTSARLPTVIMSLLIIASPLLFRRWFGSTYTAILAGLLVLSPVFLVSSRTMSGPVWSLGLVILSVWCVGQFAITRRTTYGVVGTVSFVLLAIAAEPAGFLMLAGALVGFFFAFSTLDDPDRRYREAFDDTLRGWPWVRAILLALLAVIAVGSVFMLYPAGLNSLGESLGAGLRGMLERPSANPAAYPLLVSIVYEPGFWLFGIAGAFFVLRGMVRRELQFFGKAFIGWLGASILFALTYAGSAPAHALWLTAPLIGLSAIALEKALSPVVDLFWQVPFWAPWLHGILTVASLSIAAIHLIVFGRAAMGVTPNLIPALQQQDTMKVLMVVLALLLTSITFFLVGSIWGQRSAWHGLGIGLFMFLGVYSFSTGWQASYTFFDDPRELWRAAPASQNLNLLYQTMRTASLRATGEPYAMEITVVLDSGQGDDTPLAWALHRFKNIRFANGISTALNSPAIIAARTSDKPQFGAAYVGQAFGLSSTWDRGSLSYWDFIPWLYDRVTRTAPVNSDFVVAWVRADVYGAVGTTDTPSLTTGR